MIERILKNSIKIKPEYTFGADQVYDTYPCRFATVSFLLEDSLLLELLANDYRGAPLRDGYYEFSVGLNGYNDTKVDSCIGFSVMEDETSDDEIQYAIDLSEEEQEIIFDIVNEQCIEYFSKTCDELLLEARKEMGV